MSSDSRPHKSKWSFQRIVVMTLVAFTVYVGSYLALSRVGLRHGNELGVEGYCFIPPRGPITIWMNDLSMIVYYPLILVDEMITGIGPIHVDGEISG
jgi:hypothetical protein